MNLIIWLLNLVVNVEINLRYRKLSIIQTVVITICAISVFDLGYSGFIDKGIRFNYLLFNYEHYPVYILMNPFWGEFQFWGYCMFVVSVCQLLKVTIINFDKYYQFSRISGLIGLSSFVIFHLIALLVAINDFDFHNQAFSSLVEFGTLPTILTVMSMVIPGFTFPLYCGMVTSQFSKIWQKIITNAISIFAGIMLISIGVTTRTNEPVDHGIYVKPMFFSFMVLIILLSVIPYQMGIITKNLMIYGFVTLIVYILINLFSFFAPPIILQMVIGGLYSSWFLFFGFEFHKYYSIKFAKENQIKNQITII